MSLFSHVTHISESCHTWIRHVTRTWIMSQRHGSSCHAYMTHVSGSLLQDPWFYETCHVCLIWRIHVWQDSLICVTWLIRVWHDSSRCDMTHSCVTWRIHSLHESFICDMTLLCVTWLFYVWHDSFMCDAPTLSLSHPRPYIYIYTYIYRCVYILAPQQPTTSHFESNMTVGISYTQIDECWNTRMSHESWNTLKYMSHATHEWAMYSYRWAARPYESCKNI